MKISKSLDSVFTDVRKSMRMWDTWKLKVESLDIKGQPYSSWAGMSKHDQEFNLVWNKIKEIAKDLPLEKLKFLLREAEGLE